MTANVVAKQLAQALKRSKAKSWDRVDLLTPFITTQKIFNYSNPVLVTYHPSALITKEDFQSLDESVRIKSVINSRFSVNLKRTGHYFVQFESVEDLQQYVNNVVHRDAKLFGRALTMGAIDKFGEVKSPLRNIYPCIVPELSDIRQLLAYYDNKVANQIIDQKYSQLTKVQQRAQAWDPSITNYEHLLVKTCELKNDIKYKTHSDTIDRSQCVLLSNLNFKIQVNRVLDMVWDLELHHDMPFRRAMVHPSTHRSVDIVIFKTAEMALQAIKRWDGQHALYNTEIPRTYAELL